MFRENMVLPFVIKTWYTKLRSYKQETKHKSQENVKAGQDISENVIMETVHKQLSLYSRNWYIKLNYTDQKNF